MDSDENPELGKRPLIRKALQVFILLATINFAAFVAGSLWLGGDALNGHEQDGRYFLNSHGRFTEVSHAVFAYSWWHAMSAIFGVGLTFCAIAWMAPYRAWFGRH